MRSGTRLCVALFLMLLPVPVRAAPPELSPAARAVLEAVERDDAETFATLAAAIENNPWLIVEELRTSGALSAARRYAAALDPVFKEPIEAWLETDPPMDPGSLGVLRDARRLMDAGSPGEGAELLGKTSFEANSALRVEALLARADATDASGRSGADRLYQDAAKAAAAANRDMEAEGELLFSRYGGLWMASEIRTGLGVLARIAILERAQGCPQWALPFDLARAELLFLLDAVAAGMRALDQVDRDLIVMKRMDLSKAILADVPMHVARIELLRGFNSVKTGALSAGVQYLESACEAFAELGSYRAVEARSWLAVAHAEYGNFEGAADHLRTALEMAQEFLPHLAGEDATDLLAIMHNARINLGTVLEEDGKLDEAEEILEEAHEAVVAADDSEGEVVILLSLGRILEKRDRLDSALEVHRRALDAADGDPILTAFAQLRIGDVLSVGVDGSRGVSPERWRMAARAYSAGLAASRAVAEPTLEMLLKTGLGELNLRANAPEKALDLARSAIAIFEKVTEGLADQEMTGARAQSDRLRVFDLGLAAAAALGDPGAVLDMVERSRARAFLSALGGRGPLLSRLLDKRQNRRLADANLHMTEATERFRAAAAEGDRGVIRRAREGLKEARGNYDSVLRSIERESRLLAAVSRPKIPSAAEVRAALRPGEAYVAYALLPGRSVAVLIDEKGFRTTFLPAREKLEAACRELQAFDRSTKPEDIEFRLRGLSATLIESLLLSADTETLLVSPDGGLAQLPWPLLAEAKGRSAALIPSGGVLVWLRDRKSSPGLGNLALGDPDYSNGVASTPGGAWGGGGSLVPLKHSAAEVALLTGGEHDVPLLGGEATEERLIAELSSRRRFRAVHLACHGIPNDRRPGFSALALTPTRQEDGWLTALEIYGVSVDAELIVLSACRSAGGRSRPGEGMSGLMRAFLLAGAPSVVASLATVDDEATLSFMTAFYREWGQPGTSTVDALGCAWKGMRKAGAHPADYAPWVLWGLPD